MWINFFRLDSFWFSTVCHFVCSECTVLHHQRCTYNNIFNYIVLRKKTHNSGVSWSILILFVPIETLMYTLQCTYLIPWWRHKCVTSHVRKVYFTELLLNIEYIEFWRWSLDQILIKTYENVKDFMREDWYKISYNFFSKKLKKTNIRQLSVKVASN